MQSSALDSAICRAIFQQLGSYESPASPLSNEVYGSPLCCRKWLCDYPKCWGHLHEEAQTYQHRGNVPTGRYVSKRTILCKRPLVTNSTGRDVELTCSKCLVLRLFCREEPIVANTIVPYTLQKVIDWQLHLFLCPKWFYKISGPRGQNTVYCLSSLNPHKG